MCIRDRTKLVGGEGGGNGGDGIIGVGYGIMCEGISPLGYWQEVNQSSTQSKSHNIKW